MIDYYSVYVMQIIENFIFKNVKYQKREQEELILIQTID